MQQLKQSSSQSHGMQLQPAQVHEVVQLMDDATTSVATLEFQLQLYHQRLDVLKKVMVVFLQKHGDVNLSNEVLEKVAENEEFYIKYMEEAETLYVGLTNPDVPEMQNVVAIIDGNDEEAEEETE